jgi:sugar phosphate isomerase/epimerase
MNPTRRKLLQSTALAAAATALPSFGEPRAETGKPSLFRLGMCSYTFRNFTRAQMIPMLKQLNITELNAKNAKDHLPSDPQQEAEAVADYKANGIHLHAAGAIYFSKGDEANVRAQFDYVKRAGIPVIVAGDPTPETLPRIEQFAKQYDIRIAIHNHGPEDKLWPSPLDILKDIRNLDPRIGCCIDVGHTVRAGTDVVEAIHKVGPRLYNMHMKDLASFTDKESQGAVGAGKMPVREIFQALGAIGYKGFVDLEYEIKAEDPMPGVIESIAYQRGVLTGLGYNTES